jgi:formylglycine-generating enzyme required for sulfatase activity
VDRPTWPGQPPTSGSPPDQSQDARTRAGPSPGAMPRSGSTEDARTRARPPSGPTPGSTEDARTRAGGTRAGSTSGSHPGLGSGRRAWVPGERVGPFVVKALLGQGGMGAVYTVTHETTGVDYALKVLLAIDDAMGRARFEREGQAQASLPPHPNVVRVFGAGELQGVPYLLTELAPGGDLRMRLRQGPVPPLEACGMFVGLARALDHLHARGVLHRDLKPHNIVFGADGTPKLMDFGLATLKGADKLTVTGAFMGTPNYMAPEQVDGQKVDARADVYGLGATLYQALCGRPPYDGESGVNMITKILTQPPRALRSMQPGLPADVIRVTERAMARSLEQRYPSAGALADDLARVAAGEPLDPPPPTPGAGRRRALLAAGGLAVVAVVAGGAAMALRPATTAAPTPPATEPPAPAPTPPPVVDDFPRPAAGRKGTVFVPAGTTSVPRPAWLAASESVRKGELGTSPIVRGALSLERAIETFQVTAEGKVLLTLEVVRLPAGVVALEGGKVFLNEADGSRLVFVPGGPNVQPFLLGEREVTWAQYLAFAREAKRSLDLYELDESKGQGQVAPVVTNGKAVQITAARRGPEFPVVNVTVDDARAYAERVGLRLPSRAEWFHAYEGDKPGKFPVGQGRSEPHGNILDDPPGKLIGKAHPPGSRLDDVSWCGALDMYGNVSEWCDASLEEDAGPRVKGAGQSCGGAFDDLARYVTRSRPAQENRPQGYRGMRLLCPLDRAVAPASLPTWDPDERSRLAPFAQTRLVLPTLPEACRFTRGLDADKTLTGEVALEPGLNELFVRQGPKRIARWAVVRLPRGFVVDWGEAVNEADGTRLVFVDGVEARDGQPAVAPFLIGKLETTWGQLEAWAKEAERDPPAQPGPPGPAPSPLMPAVRTLYEEAREYCERVGLRLPTTLEWSHACWGGSPSRFPWGDEASDPTRGNLLFDGKGQGGPAPVGSFPEGRSWCGALDMFGNADEWVDPAGSLIGRTCGPSWGDRAEDYLHRDGEQADIGLRTPARGFRAACDLVRAAPREPLGAR